MEKNENKRTENDIGDLEPLEKGTLREDAQIDFDWGGRLTRLFFQGSNNPFRCEICGSDIWLMSRDEKRVACRGCGTLWDIDGVTPRI